MLKKEDGFTLIEMLIVMAIIAILMILIIPNLGSKSKSVNEKGCEALENVIQTQTDAYYIEEGDYPATVEELATANYLKDDQKACADGTTFSINNGKVEPNG